MTVLHDPGIKAGGRVFGLDLTNDGALLAVACMPRGGAPAVQVWRTADASLVASYGVGQELAPGIAADGPVIHAPGAVFADGDLWFALSCRSGGPSLWRITSAGPQRVGQYLPDQFQGLIRSPDGRLLGVTGTHLEIRALPSQEIVRFIPSAGQAHEPMRACFSASEPSVCLYGRDPGAVVVHDLSTGVDRASYEAPTPFGRHVARSPSGRWMLVAGRRGTLLHDTQTGRCHTGVGSSTLSFDAFRPGHLAAFPSDGALLVLDGGLYAIDLLTPDLTTTYQRTERRLGKPVAVAAAANAPVVAWATDDDNVVWATA